MEVELTETSAQQNKENRGCSTIAILGATGNYGRALASRLQKAGLKFCLGSRKSGTKLEFGASILPYEKAINSSDIIFLTIPPHAYQTVVPGLVKCLSQKIIVDVSNLENKDDASNALTLQELLPLSYVIKALNTISAFALENDAYGATRDTFVCGDYESGKTQVMQILREIGLNPIDRGGLKSAFMIEKLPFRFFPGWGTACLITTITAILVWIYTYLRFFWYQTEDGKDKNKQDLALYYPNRVIAWVMFWVLSLTYLPGILAGFIQLCRRTKYTRFPSWLENWMNCRKQLGLICLFLASIHGCMSCLLIGAGELKYAVNNQLIQVTGKQPIVVYQLLTASKQASLLFAVFALAIMGIVGITSLPSVNAKMSWMEWDFVQRGLGFGSLLFGFIHVILYVFNLWDPDYKYGWKIWERNPKGNFPPGAFVMPMLPLLVIILKILLMCPGVMCYLNRIKKGKVGYSQDLNTSPGTSLTKNC